MRPKNSDWGSLTKIKQQWRQGVDMDFDGAISSDYLSTSRIVDEEKFFQPKLTISPEHALMRAVFLDGLYWAKQDPETNRLHRRKILQARMWIRRSDTDVFGFESICEAFKLNPQAVRKALGDMPIEGKPRREQPEHRRRNPPATRYNRHQLTIADDPNAPHEYRGMTHCRYCKARYDMAYYKATRGKRRAA